MGNRASIIFADDAANANEVVYLHWNGSPNEVASLLEYCRLRNFSAGDYGVSRFLQVAGNYIGGGLSLGIYSRESNGTDAGDLDEVDPGDNGTFLVKNWSIVRWRCWGEEMAIVEGGAVPDSWLMRIIDACQPQRDQLGAEFLGAQDSRVASLEVGDRVYMQSTRGNSSGWALVRVLEKKRDGGAVVGLCEPYDAEEDRTYTYADVPANNLQPTAHVYKAQD